MALETFVESASPWPRRLYVLALLLAGSIVVLAIGNVIVAVQFPPPLGGSGWLVLQTATQWAVGFPCLMILAAVGLLLAPLMAWVGLNGWRSVFLTTLRWFALVALLVAAASVGALVSTLWGLSSLPHIASDAAEIAQILVNLAIALAIAYVAWAGAAELPVLEDSMPST